MPPGTPVEYPEVPPAFEGHEEVPDTMGRKPVQGERLAYDEKAFVHNLEHGYTTLWYDESIADDDEQMVILQGIAEKLCRAPATCG